VRLRARLTIAFALFAAAPMLLAVLPLSRALSEGLKAEYAARLDGAALAVQGELRRLGAAAVEAARDVSRSPEVVALSRDRALGALDPAEVARLAAEWMEARGLDVLAVTDARGLVISSGHLPGRAGDADPELRALYASAGPGHAEPRLVPRASAAGVEPALALVAWEAVPSDPSLRVAAGVALGPSFAERVAALAGGTVAVRGEGDVPLSAEGSGGALRRFATRLLGAPRDRVRSVPVAAGRGAPLAFVEVTLPAAGLERAQITVAVVFLATLAAAVASAALVGHLLARRITRPLEALRAGAARVAGGDLRVRVDVPASGELGDLVRGFNAMTADLEASRVRAATAERVAAWQEVARRLAHEIKNPLTPIAMSVSTLQDALAEGRPDFPELFAEGTSAIQEEVRRLKRIVDEFSRFARLPAPEPSEIGAADLVAAVLALYSSPPAGVLVERRIEAGLPPVRADRDQMLQVLLNLVKNAEEAMPSGGTLRIAARRVPDGVAIDVTDSGSGIAPEDLPRVLEPYFTTKASGTGLGLSIADRIVREHGGRLEVASGPGRGTTFTVRLPAAVPVSGPASP